jgi:hypothetical protein
MNQKYPEGTKIISHKEQDIIYLDYRGLKKPEEFQEKVGETIKRTKYYLENNIKDILVLTDLNDSYIYGNATKFLKESTKMARPFVKKSAVIGISGAKRILLNMVNLFSGYETKAFQTIEEAKDWLVK